MSCVADKIRAIQDDVVHTPSEALEHFGIKVGNKLIEPPCKQLRAPPIIYHDRNRNPVTVSVDGKGSVRERQTWPHRL